MHQTRTSASPLTSPLNSLLTSSSSRIPKHEGYDRTGDWTTRVKMTQELVQLINDGLHYYEEELWRENNLKVRLYGSLFSNFKYKKKKTNQSRILSNLCNTQYGSSSSIEKTVQIISQEDFEKMTPKVPKKENPEVPPPPPSCIEDIETPQATSSLQVVKFK